MNNVRIYHDTDVQRTVRGRDIGIRVGEALAKAYPRSHWNVQVNIDGGVMHVACPAISAQHGMTLHLTHNLIDLEAKAIRQAGELLERFRISRTTGQTDHLRRRIDGQAIGAARGEQ